jgi:hypothetical protein
VTGGNLLGTKTPHKPALQFDVVAGSLSVSRRTKWRRKAASASGCTNTKNHKGSSADDSLREEGVSEEAQAPAIKEVVAWDLAQAMK